MSTYPNHNITILENDISHLKELLNQRITLLEEKDHQYKELLKENVRVALSTLDERMNKTNEFRQQLETLIRTLASNDKVEGIDKKLDVKIDLVSKDILKQVESLAIRMADYDKWKSKEGGIRLAMSIIIPTIITFLYFLASYLL